MHKPPWFSENSRFNWLNLGFRPSRCTTVTGLAKRAQAMALAPVRVKARLKSVEEVWCLCSKSMALGPPERTAMPSIQGKSSTRLKRS
ncbi:hypothetical protein D3C80_2043040 [compost metagenome]